MPQEEGQEEVIRLQGGPRDGATYGWRGGDVLKFTILPPSELTNRAMVSAPAVPEEILYRRSLGTRYIFVFQP